MKDILIVITGYYPYGKGEEFFETEIKYLSKSFDRIYIIPSTRDFQMMMRSHPGNVEIKRPESKRIDLIFSPKYIFNEVFQKELSIIKNEYKMKLNGGMFISMLATMYAADRIYKIIAGLLESVKSESNIYLYSYWMNHGALAISGYKSKNKHVKAFCRAHGADSVSYTHLDVYKRQALRHAQQKDTAAVVLGCQAESILKIRENYPRVKLPLYTIGLVCAGQNSGYMIDDLIEQSKCGKGESVTRFRFKDKSLGKWPGNVGVYTDRRIYKLNKQRRLDLKSIYESYRCILCYDQMNICSDLVAVSYTHLAAHAQGLGTCWVAWFDEDKVRAVCRIPSAYKVVAMTPLGVGAQEPAARPRKKLEEIAFKEEWGLPLY